MMIRSQLVEELLKYSTISKLQASDFYREQAADLQRLLHTPELANYSAVVPRLPSFLRVTSWNIEKGKQLEGLLSVLQEHPILRWSDLILLNEVDVGMNRSGNHHVARVLAQRLGMNYVFAPAHLELTRGMGDDLLKPGMNTSALQGNAILARYPILHPRILDLPVCSEPFHLEEKRFGRRIALMADLPAGGEPITVVCTHLEVRNTPACRARQMNDLLESLAAAPTSARLLIAGDFNTNSFARGGTWRTLRAFFRLAYSDPARLRHHLVYPDVHAERLFRGLVQRGFKLEGFNDRQPTASAPLKGLEDSRFIPGLLRPWAVDKMRRHDFQLPMRLDWIAAQGLEPLSAGAQQDSSTGVYSISAQTIKGLRFDGRPISDHDPITADIQFQS